MQADLAAIRRRLSDADDGELYRVAHASEHEYIPEVVELARELLSQRGLNPDSLEGTRLADVRRDEVSSRRREERNTQSEQFTFVLCAIGGFMIAVIVTCVLAMQGRQHLIRFAWKGFAIGLLIKIGAALLLVVIVTAAA